MTDSRKKKYAPELGVMIDCSRDAVISMPALKQLIRLSADMGYHFVGLYLEDTLEIEDEPYFGYQRGRFRPQEIREADKYARSMGLELRPYIQTLAHLNQIADYEAYSEIIDTADILLAGEKRTLELLDHLLKTVSECFSSRKVNIGMDEAHMVGLGRYLDKHGYTDRVQILLDHLNSVMDICRKYGLQPQMWSDMFFRLLSHGEYYTTKDLTPDAADRIHIPEGLSLCYWDYYNSEEEHYLSMLKAHSLLTDDIAFAGGAWRWMGFTPYNRYSIRITDAALAACRKQQVSSIVMTMWGDDGGEGSVFALLPALFLAAARAVKKPDEKQTDTLYSTDESKAFEELTGYSLDEFLLLDDANPFTAKENGKNNLSKILLYNDPLLGIFDKALSPEDADRLRVWFQSTSEKLLAVCAKTNILKNAGVSNREFDYLFRTQAALCSYLVEKNDFGLRLRAAYKAGDRPQLRDIAENQIESLLTKLASFYEAFQQQWMLENRPFGFEVHTIRIGGQRQRLEDIKKRLSAYLEGTIGQIEELDQDLLPPGYVFDSKELKNLEFNRYEKITTTSRLTW